MGLMDKVKQQAEQALAKAQQGVSQGQAKLDQVQTKRQADGLLRDLGAAYYAQQRTGGSVEAVNAALAAVDEHASAHGPVDVDSRSGADGADGTAPAPAPPSPPMAGTAPAAGSFSIDDVEGAGPG